jgi:hypothetical protein
MPIILPVQDIGVNFPAWSPMSPQSPNAILGIGLMRGVEDLQKVFVQPEYDDTEKNIALSPALTKQKADSRGGRQVSGVVVPGRLFQMFQESQSTPPAAQVSESEKK